MNPNWITVSQAVYLLGLGALPKAGDIETAAVMRTEKEVGDHTDLIVGELQSRQAPTDEESEALLKGQAEQSSRDPLACARRHHILERLREGERLLFEGHLQDKLILAGIGDGQNPRNYEVIPKGYFFGDVVVDLADETIVGDGAAAEFGNFEINQRHTRWLKVRVDREEVLAWAKASRSKAGSTIGAEIRCERWLIAQMEQSERSLHPKGHYRNEAKAKFGVGHRPFDRVWGNAIHQTGRTGWKHPGRKPRPNQKSSG